MKFNIFWIDDAQKTWVNSIESEVLDIFKEIGFEPNIKKFEDTTNAKDPILEAYADLLLIDYNLPEGTNGDQFIKDLRINRCFAHVIFYSQNSSNLQKIEEDKRFIHITDRSNFIEILTQVADHKYRKYTHPAFMRGLLLSEFIDLENLMDDLIAQCFKLESQYFHKTIIQEGGESFSLSAKKKFIARLVSDTGNEQTLRDKINEVEFTPSKFEKHIISKRNILAHAHPEYNKGSGEIMLVSANKNIDFNADWFHETREHIYEHKIKIKKLIDMKLREVVNA